MMLSNFVISQIRTYVPILVGTLLTWLASSLHVVVTPSSQAGLVALCVSVLSVTYYALVRLLEHKWPQLGVLLGVPAKPKYGPQHIATVVYGGSGGGGGLNLGSGGSGASVNPPAAP